MTRPEDGVVALLAMLGDNPTRPGLVRTPRRWVQAMMDLASPDPETAVDAMLAVTFPEEPSDQMIAVGPVEFVSVCEHHLLPFTGDAWVAYVPDPTSGIVGLSKLARLVDHYARRPQVQERLTQQITTALDTRLHPRGSACLITATHSCLALRGAKKDGARMVTSSLTGVFRDEDAARAEFMALSRR